MFQKIKDIDEVMI